MNDFLNVLEQEAKAILQAKDHIDLSEVDKIVDVLLHLKGKFIIVGLGKGGHVGKKMAASFSSMGIPSFFIHATELFHGDFGMVQNNDVILLISHSGTTKEVVEAAKTFKKRGNITIALSSSNTTVLSLTCDYKLNYGISIEADHLNMAPTNSSTVMLAVGDALMVTVSKKKGYSKDDFKTNHPGGALGTK